MEKYTSVKVRCSGSLHTISLSGRGALVLHNHDIEAERALVALGGEPCRCLQVLGAWRKRDRKILPADLRPALDASIARRETRRENRSFTDPLISKSLVSRAALRVAEVATAELKRCSYRRSETRWAGGDHVARAHVGEPGISGDSVRVWSENGKWSGTDSYVTASVPLSWLRRVHRRSLSVIGGAFVIDILDDTDPAKIRVLAGKQGRGFEVNPCPATITTAKDGSLRLRWEKIAKEAK